MHAKDQERSGTDRAARGLLASLALALRRWRRRSDASRASTTIAAGPERVVDGLRGELAQIATLCERALDVGALDAAARRDLEQIRNAAEHATQLCAELLPGPRER